MIEPPRPDTAATIDWFWRLFEDLPFSLQLFAPDGRCVAANHAWERLWGVPRTAAAGYDILADQALARAGVHGELRRAFAGAATRLSGLLYAGGSSAPDRLVNLSLLPIESGRARYLVAAIEDVTALRDGEQRAGVQLALTDVLARSRSAEEAVTGLLAGLGAAFDAQFAAFWTVRGDGGALQCAQVWLPAGAGGAAADFARRSREMEFARGVGLPGSVWLRLEPIWLDEVLAQDNFPRLAWMRAAGFRGGLALPIVSGSDLYAVLEVFTARPLPHDGELARLALDAGRRFGLYLQRRRLEDELQESEAANRAVVETALDAIVAMDAHGRIVDVNPAAERMFGFRRSMVVGRDMAETIVPPDLRPAHRTGLRRLRETGVSRILSKRLELTALRADGTHFPVELTITRMQRHHAPLFIGFLRDLTERRRHEHEREALLARERAARDAAEAANRSKDEFIATVSHELRAPINAIRGWLRALAGGAVPADKLPELLDRLERNAEMQSRLVDDLLDVSTLVTGRMRFTVGDVNLREVIENACESLRPAAEVKSLALTVYAPPTAIVRGDAVRLQQVFWNLLSNAVKFTPAGGAIDVTVSERAGELHIAVADTGPGIDAELLPLVFEKFRQGRLGDGGLGLGLAIVKHIVEAHAGTVVAANRPHGGAVLTITLPRI